MRNRSKMAPNAKVKAAVRAMKNIGIPEEKTKPALKNLMKLYEKKWDLIEAENYRVLADAIFEYEESEAANEEQKAVILTSSPRDALEEEDSLMADELERPLKRSRSKYLGQASPSHGQTSSSQSIAPELSKLEYGGSQAFSPRQCVQRMTSSHVSPQPVMSNKGKQPLSLQNAEVNIERQQPYALVQVEDSPTSKLKQPETSALVKVKQEPFTDDMVSFKPLAVVRPEPTHPEVIHNTSNPTDEHNDQQSEASKSVEEIAKGEGVPVSPTTKEVHMKESDASLKSPTTIDIAASPRGEVKLCFICCSGPNLPNFSVPDSQAVLKKMEENFIRTFMNPDFTITKFMGELCKCVVDLGTNSDGIREETTCFHDARFVDNKETCSGSSLSGSRNVESPENVLASSDTEFIVPLLLLPLTEQTFCIQFGEHSDDNNSADGINEKTIVVEQHRHPLDHDNMGCVFDMSDITRGEEKTKVSSEQSNNKFPSFRYVTRNVIFSDADLKFSFAEIGDQDHCISCGGDCLSSLPLCNCAQQTAGDSPYAINGLVKEAFLEECMSVVRNRIQYMIYCKDCPLERSVNDDMQDPCKGHLKRKFIKECWVKCGCIKSCGNRVIQEGIKYNLQVFWTPEGKGWGLRTLEEIPKGAFVCEYVGDILTVAELHERNVRLSDDKNSYSVLLDANWASRPLKENEALCLDAKLCGNVARFINHRCSDANLIEIPVEVESPNRQYYHVALFTTRKVDAFEELTWDYGVDFDDNEYHIKAFNCLCGSELCRNMKSSKDLELQ